MQRIIDVIGHGKEENVHGFEAILLKDETGAQFQLFVNAGQLSLVRLEPSEAEVPAAEAEDTDDEEVIDLLKAFGEVFGRCTNPKCRCQE